MAGGLHKKQELSNLAAEFSGTPVATKVLISITRKELICKQRSNTTTYINSML